MKLPMDLTNIMPGFVDQAAKFGSLNFMCVMMANLLPSLATTDNKELVSNIIAVGVLVITLVVNVCIQINTGIISYQVGEDGRFFQADFFEHVESIGFFAAVTVGLLLMLLIIYGCSSLAILKSKQILESKYQATHETALQDQQLGKITVKRLKQYVSNYSIMAGTGSPQFMTICWATTSASGVIYALSTFLHTLFMLLCLGYGRDDNSDYKWSTFVILIIQYIGVILGTIAPLSRCFAALSFNLSIEYIWNRINVSKVESYWTQKLYDWKQSSILFLSSSRKCKIVIHHSKILVLNICIGFQNTVVVACKIIAVIPIFYVICISYFLRFWKWLDVFSCILLEDSHGNMQDLSRYVLQHQDDMEFAERTLKGISKSVNALILNAEKQQPKNLMKLILAESRGFLGIQKFDSHHVPSLLSQECLNCWSLPVVTLTTIAISLPKSQNNIIDRLLSSVSEGLVYATLVEECLNATDENVITIQKAAKTLWLEVEVYHKWLGNKLHKPTSQENTVRQILQWLRDTAKNKVDELESENTRVPNDNNSKYISICANSMYRICETILISYHKKIDQVNREELFAEILSRIADILAACLTNLPQVIAMKCHTSSIEKREASVYDAVQLLGETMEIINTLRRRELPRLNSDELAFIDNWRAYFKHPFP